jgi:signal peptidase I
VISVFIGLVILGLLFFKFMPGFGIYIVKSGSMSPVINTGDIVFTRPQDDILGYVKPGQIITFQSGEILITHRAVAIENGMIKTKGDANEDTDWSCVSPSEIKGIYLFKIPVIGLITNVLHSRLGWFLIIVVPSALLVLMLVKEILKEAFKKEDKVLTRK